MSQYLPPYPPAPPAQGAIDFSYYAPQQAELLAPARRAAILQAIAGALLLVCGVCVGAVPWTMDLGQLANQPGVTLPQLPPGMTIEEVFRIAYTVIGVVAVVFGVALLVLSYFVRNGRMAPAVISIVIEALVLIVLAINLVTALAQAGSQPLAAVVALVIVLVPIGLFGLNVIWLISAARNASHLTAARLQQQAQLMQYEQQRYMQAGAYGMGYPPAGYGYAPAPPQPQYGQYPAGPYGVLNPQAGAAAQPPPASPQATTDPDVPPNPPPPTA